MGGLVTGVTGVFIGYLIGTVHTDQRWRTFTGYTTDEVPFRLFRALEAKEAQEVDSTEEE